MKDNGAEVVSEEIINAENFPKLIKTQKTQAEAVLRTGRINYTSDFPKPTTEIIVKLLKTKKKKKIFKAPIRKKTYYASQKKCSGMFNTLRRKNRILYSEKISFKKKGQIDFFRKIKKKKKSLPTKLHHTEVGEKYFRLKELQYQTRYMYLYENKRKGNGINEGTYIVFFLFLIALKDNRLSKGTGVKM